MSPLIERSINIVESIIFNCYEQYKKFMDLSDDILPMIKPVVDFTDRVLAYVNANEILQPTVPLYYNPKLFTYAAQFYQSKLFHEFTHIFDATSSLKLFDYKSLKKLLAIYSEYHASQTELACNIGFKNIHTFRKINLDKTFVMYENKRIKICNDYLQPFADALCIINEPIDAYINLSASDYFLKYKTFETKTMYYLGKQRFCERLSFKKIPNTTKQNYGNFYPYLEQIEKSIINKDFEDIIIAKEKLWSYYKTYFLNSDYANLP